MGRQWSSSSRFVMLVFLRLTSKSCSCILESLKWLDHCSRSSHWYQVTNGKNQWSRAGRGWGHPHRRGNVVRWYWHTLKDVLGAVGLATCGVDYTRTEATVLT